MENFEKTLSSETVGRKEQLEQVIAERKLEINAILESIGGEENLDDASKEILARIKKGEASLSTTK